MDKEFREIPLSQGKTALVDADIFMWLNQWKWTYHNGGYAYRAIGPKVKRESVMMHRQITEASKGLQVDHINRDKLDNRRLNLRVCNASLNAGNATKKKNGTSKYKGVYWAKNEKKWVSKIRIGTRRKHLGCFDNQEDAALAYNFAILDKYGDAPIYMNGALK